jgi:phenylacetate-CoA ligase
VNLIAAECPRTGLMHVAGGSVVVEVVRDGVPVKEGETGEVLVTALHSFTAPFVRYEQGDVARRGPDRCPCGAEVATIQEIQGRVADRFPLPDGRTVHPYELTAGMLNEPWARQYEFVQERPDLIRVRVVGLDRVGAEERRRVLAGIQRSCGPAVRVELEAVDALAPAPNGKFRPYRSLVSGAA